jgi:hypothetical protein
MIKTSEEFESAMLSILKGVKDEKDINEISNSLGQGNFNDALEECLSKGLVKGLTYQKGIVSIYNPRPSYLGLKYIESKI